VGRRCHRGGGEPAGRNQREDSRPELRHNRHDIEATIVLRKDVARRISRYRRVVLSLPSSPRARRRLVWAASAFTLLFAGLSVALLVPSRTASNVEPTGPLRPAQLAVNTQQKLAPADRRAIDALLDSFYPAAVARRDPTTAWKLSGPEMRSGSTLADFRHGTSPVPSYPASERNYHHWRAIDVEGNSVVLNILVHPKDPTKLGTWVFSTQVVKVHGRWLVNHIYPIAIMNPPTRAATVTHEIGPADFASAPPQKNPSTTGPSSHSYLAPVAAIVGLVLLIPLTLGVIALRRTFRWKRSVRASGRTELPPLPRRTGGGPESA
jgi:hypothetical protein